VVRTEAGGYGVQLDRRGEIRVLPWREGQWIPTEDSDRLTPIQKARICYDADRAWQMVHGAPYSTKEWHSLRDDDRRAWILGPPANADRRRLRLFRAILGVLA
jgi:hypothetical protein